MPYTFDPMLLAQPDEKLEESAAAQLRHCQAIQALLVKRHDALAEAYDKAPDMEKVREIRGKRKALMDLLRLVEPRTQHPAPPDGDA